MHTKNFSAVVLAATLAACGPVNTTAPDAQGADASTPDVVLVADATPAQPDAFAPDVSAPDAAVADASGPDATAPDATAPDASAPDAAVPDAGPGTRAVASASRICGVAVVPQSTSPRSDFTIAWAQNDGAGENSVHVAQVDAGGALANEHVVARDSRTLCVTRGSLASDGSAVFWSHDGESYSTIQGAVLDESAAPVVTLVVPYGRAESVTLTQTNLVAARSGSTVTLAFESFQGSGPGIRALEFDLGAVPSAAPGGVLPMANPSSDHLLSLDVPSSGYRVLLADGLVAFTRPAVPSGVTVHARAFYSRGWDGEEFAVPLTGTDSMPLSLRGSFGSFELVYDSGLRERSVYRLAIPRSARDEATPTLVAANTAWYATDADMTAGRPDVLWTSHGLSGGYNTDVLLAPAGQAEPHRCVAFRASGEQGRFVALAHAQRASRNRLLAAVASVPEGRTGRQILYVRGVADGGTVCE